SVTIKDGELARVAAPDGAYVKDMEGTWHRATVASARLVTKSTWDKEKGQGPSLATAGVSGREDKHLPAIAALLDPKQFDIVTRADGLLVVQGGAGSGKTTVGLHRAAYLAFSDPSRFRPDRMMIVVPHDALRHYVARVLPSLGVEGVRITTFTRFADRILPDLYPKMPTRRSDETPAVVGRAKEHAAMLRAIQAAGERMHRELDRICERGMQKWPDGDKVIAAWKATGTDPAIAPDGRVSVFSAWSVGKRRIPNIPDPGLLPQGTRSAIDGVGKELRHRSRGVLAVWDELLTSRERLAKIFSELEPGEERFSSAQLDQIHEWCLKRARVLSEGERDGDEGGLDPEDVPMLLRLWQVIRGPLSEPNGQPIRFSHLFVDEVQDATPIALRVLLDMTTKDRSVTLAGDTAQRMLTEGDERGEFDWTKLLSELKIEATAVSPLRVSYRSTAEITTFSRGVLGPLAHEGDEEPIVTRHGPPVELFTFASPGECVAFLADALQELARIDPSANVALMARFPEQADVYFEGLARAEVPRLRRVAQQDFTWEPGVDVTDVRQTKGLEFDEVVLLETNLASYPESAPARHALYVGSTRAANQLWCTASGAASLLVTKALAASEDGGVVEPTS
ncbi:MAG: ATP-binding domain-containing protein, partial [Polyangiaceae bacterium]